jgi:hypothetical protein
MDNWWFLFCLVTNSIDDIEDDNKRFIRHRFVWVIVGYIGAHAQSHKGWKVHSIEDDEWIAQPLAHSL